MLIKRYVYNSVVMSVMLGKVTTIKKIAQSPLQFTFKALLCTYFYGFSVGEIIVFLCVPFDWNIYSFMKECFM